ncbi:hypothetical protein ADK56_06655 [Streptomyces sp. MMG1522]|nr:hypothetical protein ADK33_24160 [Streptomyces griseus subsp. rhodochrous]KOU52758.1 hypothetical protein ADK56_06655 [Streptomyces sp. MMG1522]
MGAVVGRGMPFGVTGPSPTGAGSGPDAERSELVERKDPVGEPLQHMLDPVELGVAVGSGDSFLVLMRWKVTTRRASRHRNASRPIRITRPCTRRR